MISRAHRRPARMLVVLSLTAPMAALLVSASVSPAAASSFISAPAANTIYSSETTTTVTADLDPCAGTTMLKVVNPQGDNSWQIQSSRPSGCDGLFPPSSRRRVSVKPTWTAASPNGAFTATLTGGASATTRFYTNFKPLADPANLAAAANGMTEVDLSWSYSGAEPDKAGFEIIESHGDQTRTLQAPASACGGSSCGFAITGYPQPAVATTEDYSYTVRALRSSGGCGSCGDYTRSGSSSSATAQLVGPPPPPSPTPTPTPTDGGTTGSTTGTTTTGGTTGSTTGGTTGSTTGGTTGTTGSTTGGSTTGSSGTTGGTTGSAAKPITIPTLPPLVASRRAFALGFNNFSPSLGIPKLPPLPATTFPVTAPGTETYEPTLPYKAEPRKTTSVLSSPIAAITDSVDTEQLVRSLAVALILLAAAAHVRIFLSHSVED
ncbi:MAG TPA: hypothetical protein VM097_00460 [Mycobacteriales bacterium]|nr:hypothetical protein [Mycobacteriales bacterium]